MLTVFPNIALGATTTAGRSVLSHRESSFPSTQVSPAAASSRRVAQRLNFSVRNVRSSPSRIGGFARGDACFSNPQDAQRPMALLPVPANETGSQELETQAIGLMNTLEDRPTFFVYVPAMGVQKGEFTLWSDDQTELLTEKTVTLPEQAGVVALTLPEEIVLEPGDTYYWTLEVLCNEDDRSRNAFVEGLVQRVTPDTALVEQLQQALPRDRPALYADAGYWYETLSSLAQLRYENPADTSLQAEWENLLDSVNLDTAADAPLAPPPPSEPAPQ
ncbi:MULTISPECIES: DUF928 domain-containing protein [unclassified Leptolyngbya]|uniref:DUF928 domain-containing protein n=1 Tax=unclassified Leptolyngbya TaxID=2650499 RepID=UPI001681F6EF|nr:MULTISPECIES: DUF928 domain-containing protein [unclassified Leptolyngbya]MBD1912144.1 DUF928 domain-containing protein [Leptolyngbya sp. FACHB-8]